MNVSNDFRFSNVLYNILCKMWLIEVHFSVVALKLGLSAKGLVLTKLGVFVKVFLHP